MRVFFIGFILSFMMISCKISKGVIDFDYIGESNYDSFYIVDTIQIVDPLLISSKNKNGQYIVSKMTLEKHSKEKDFLSRADVFIYGDDLYRLLPIEKYGQYKYSKYDECDKFKLSNFDHPKFDIYEFKIESVEFLLGLINANYYYQKSSGFHVNIPNYREFNYKRNFYKIVFPYCK